MKRAKREWRWRRDALHLQRLGFPPFTKRPRVLWDGSVLEDGRVIPVQLIQYTRRTDAIR